MHPALSYKQRKESNLRSNYMCIFVSVIVITLFQNKYFYVSVEWIANQLIQRAGISRHVLVCITKCLKSQPSCLPRHRSQQIIINLLPRKIEGDFKMINELSFGYNIYRIIKHFFREMALMSELFHTTSFLYTVITLDH